MLLEGGLEALHAPALLAASAPLRRQLCNALEPCGPLLGAPALLVLPPNTHTHARTHAHALVGALLHASSTSADAAHAASVALALLLLPERAPAAAAATAAVTLDSPTSPNGPGRRGSGHGLSEGQHSPGWPPLPQSGAETPPRGGTPSAASGAAPYAAAAAAPGAAAAAPGAARPAEWNDGRWAASLLLDDDPLGRLGQMLECDEAALRGRAARAVAHLLRVTEGVAGPGRAEGFAPQADGFGHGAPGSPGASSPLRTATRADAADERGRGDGRQGGARCTGR